MTARLSSGHGQQLRRLARSIRRRRKELKIRQAQLALATGVGRRFLIELESGKPSCQLGRSLLVAEALGLNPADILGSETLADNAAPRTARSYRRRDRGTGWSIFPYTLSSRLVGRIDVDRNGPGFTYNPDWVALRGAFPISITMPLKADRIASDIFLPWAANLLPESEQLRTLGQLLGLSRSDVIGLLSADRWRHRRRSLNRPTWQNRYSSMAVGRNSS